MSTNPNSGKSGETPRQRFGGYVLGIGGLCIISALYVAEYYWRVALWLVGIGIIVAYVGALASEP
jgi:hypothetical protein